MASKKYIEYGMVAAKIGPTDSETTLSKEHFFAVLEERYPSADGWVVDQKESILVRTNYGGSEVELPYVTYHTVKVSN